MTLAHTWHKIEQNLSDHTWHKIEVTLAHTTWHIIRTDGLVIFYLTSIFT